MAWIDVFVGSHYGRVGVDGGGSDGGGCGRGSSDGVEDARMVAR